MEIIKSLRKTSQIETRIRSHSRIKIRKGKEACSYTEQHRSLALVNAQGNKDALKEDSHQMNKTRAEVPFAWRSDEWKEF